MVQLSLLLFHVFLELFLFFLPLKPQSCARTLLKCTLHCCFYEHQLLLRQWSRFSDTETMRCRQKRHPRGSGDVLTLMSVYNVHRHTFLCQCTKSLCRSSHNRKQYVQKAPQCPMTSGWRSSTCDLCCWPTTVACFLFFVKGQPHNRSNQDCHTALTSVNVEQFGQTQSVVRLGNMTKCIWRGKKCVNRRRFALKFIDQSIHYPSRLSFFRVAGSLWISLKYIWLYFSIAGILCIVMEFKLITFCNIVVIFYIMD